MFQLLEGDLGRGVPSVPPGHLPRRHLHLGGAQIRLRGAISGLGTLRRLGPGWAQCCAGMTGSNERFSIK